MLLQRTLFPLSLSHILQLSLYAKQNVHFPFENKATQRPTDKSTDEWNKQGGPSEDGRGLLWADTSWWDDRVLPVLSYTLIIKPCLGGILSKRLMRGRQTENKSDLARVKGRAPHSHGMYWWKLCRVCGALKASTWAWYWKDDYTRMLFDMWREGK